MAEFRPVHASIVVVADSNNPQLLNPDFLGRNQIVQEKWTAANVIVTPPYAVVQYAEGLTITMEEKKLTFGVDSTKIAAWQEIMPGIAIRFVEILPHVVYRAAGLNFTFHSDDPSGERTEQILISNVLAKGDWLGFCGGITGAIVEFQYRKSEPMLTLRLGVRETTKEGKKTLLGYSVTANYHHEFSPEQTAERASFLRQFGKKYEDCQALLKQLPLGVN